MRPRVLGRLSLAALLAMGLSGGARAEDGDQGPSVGPQAPSELRVYPVRALTRGHPVYRVDRGPYPPRADQVNDEAHPLYGSEGDDPNPEFGSAADVIECLRSEVADPMAFAREGVSLAVRRRYVPRAPRSPGSARGGRRVARSDDAPRAAHRPPRRRGLSRRTCRRPTRPGGVPAAVASGAWVPLGVVRMVLSPQGTGAARAGAVRAYLQDFDVEVAAESSTADPTLGVASEGLAVEAVTSGVLGDRARVHLCCWWASPATWEERTTKDGDRIEVPTIAGATLDADVDLGGGTWTVLPATGDTVFAARLRVRWDAGVESVARREPASREAPPPPGPLVLRSFDVRDLCQYACEAPRSRGRAALRATSRPPVLRSLPESAALVTPDGLATFLQSLAAPASWAREGTSIEGSTAASSFATTRPPWPRSVRSSIGCARVRSRPRPCARRS